MFVELERDGTATKELINLSLVVGIKAREQENAAKGRVFLNLIGEGYVGFTGKSMDEMKALAIKYGILKFT